MAGRSLSSTPASTTPGAGTFQFVGTAAGLPVAQQGTWNVGTLTSITNTVTVSGTVGISGTVPSAGTFWQATQPVSGTVTANAGTNLNTSLLALESGGNLATIAGTISASKVNVNVSSRNVAATQSGTSTTRSRRRPPAA